MRIDSLAPSSRREEGAGCESPTLTTYRLSGLHEPTTADSAIAALDQLEPVLLADVWIDAGELTVLTARPFEHGAAAIALTRVGLRLLSTASEALPAPLAVAVSRAEMAHRAPVEDSNPVWVSAGRSPHPTFIQHPQPVASVRIGSRRRRSLL